jgi:hypothetical protein
VVAGDQVAQQVFMPRHPSVYGNLLRDLIARHHVDCWLVNTGWTGGGSSAAVSRRRVTRIGMRRPVPTPPPVQPVLTSQQSTTSIAGSSTPAGPAAASAPAAACRSGSPAAC